MGTSEYRDQRAHDLRARYRALFGGDELPVPVESIAEDYLGLSVRKAALDGLSGVLYPSERRIELNAEEPEARRRFTLAHELGHWAHHVVGARDSRPVYCRTADVRPADGAADFERDANVFAAELLMPERAVRTLWRRSPALAEAAAAFAVSTLAMHWRLFNFGLLDHRP